MLSDVQLFNLVLVKEIDAICQKYGIEYYLAGGSVIGVLRHKGFIPWDDDMDLYMTRDNWLKFREAFDKEQPKDRVLESSDINPNYPNMIAKYTSTNTTAIYKNLLSGNYAAGVIVDILILDPVPSDPAIQQDHLRNLLLYSEFVNRYYVFSHRFDIDIDFDAALEREEEIGHEALVREYEQLVTKYSEEESDTYVLRWGGVPHTFAKDLFGTPKWMPFEGIMLPVPQKAFMYLSQLYGEDWIQLPPLEEERVHDAVFSIERPYSEFFEEFGPHFDEEKYLEAIMGRKRNRIQSGPSYRALQNGTLEFECRRLQMKYRRLNETHGFMKMYEEGRFEELQELFGEYVKGQCGSRMLGNKYYGGVYRYYHPEFVDLGDDLNWLVVELLSRQGRLHHPKRLIEACLFRNGKLSVRAQEQKKLIAEMISIIDAFEQGRFEEVAARAERGLEQKPDWINFIKLQILALQRSGQGDVQAIRSLVASGKEIAPEDGDWLKYEADTYVDENPAYAEELYLQARENTRNGASLLDISEYFASNGEDSGSVDDSSDETLEHEEQGFERVQEADLLDTERVHLQLMREIKDICETAGIRYYLANRAALMAYAIGGVTDGATSPTILIHVEDAERFAEAFKNKQIPNRVLDSMLTNNKYPTFSFRYSDTTTLCLMTRQLSNFVTHGMYVHIGFLEHRPAKNARRLGSMLKIGWYDLNCVNARSSSVGEKSRVAQNAVSKAFNAEKDALVGSRLFHLLVKLYSGKSDLYQVNEPSLALVKYASDMIDGVQDTADVCGTEFTTFCDADDYLKRQYGRHYVKNAMKRRNMSVYRIVDPEISYDDYYRENRDLISDQAFQEKLFENRFFNATNRKYMKVLDREWSIAMYIDKKWELEKRYAEQRDEIDSLYSQGRYEDLADILLPYIGHFNSPKGGIMPFFDDHLLDVCEVFLFETERFGRLKKLLKRRERVEMMRDNPDAEQKQQRNIGKSIKRNLRRLRRSGMSGLLKVTGW